jgi:hypothetical protein
MRKSKWKKILASIGIVFLIVFVVIPPFTRRWYRNHSIKYAPPVPANNWKKFSSPEGEFSVWFPGNPEQTNILSNFSRVDDEKTVETAEVETRIYYVNSNIQNSFAVGYCDSPLFSKAAKLPDPQVFLKQSQALQVAAEMGKVVFEQESKFEGNPAREFEYAAGGKANYSVRVKYILVDQRIYTIYVVYLTANPHPEDRAVFFNSFKILAN